MDERDWATAIEQIEPRGTAEAVMRRVRAYEASRAERRRRNLEIGICAILTALAGMAMAFVGRVGAGATPPEALTLALRIVGDLGRGVVRHATEIGACTAMVLAMGAALYYWETGHRKTRREGSR